MDEIAVTTAENYPQLLLENQLCFPLYAAARRVVNAYTQYVAFMCLWEQGEMCVGDLCARLHLDNGTVTPLVKRMEQEGYLVRCRCREDERMVKIRLTEKGWALRDAVKDVPARVGCGVPLTLEDAAALQALLKKML